MQPNAAGPGLGDDCTQTPAILSDFSRVPGDVEVNVKSLNSALERGEGEQGARESWPQGPQPAQGGPGSRRKGLAGYFPSESTSSRTLKADAPWEPSPECDFRTASAQVTSDGWMALHFLPDS